MATSGQTSRRRKRRQHLGCRPPNAVFDTLFTHSAPRTVLWRCSVARLHQERALAPLVGWQEQAQPHGHSQLCAQWGPVSESTFLYGLSEEMWMISIKRGKNWERESEKKNYIPEEAAAAWLVWFARCLNHPNACSRDVTASVIGSVRRIVWGT